jgi:hypothetical protein
MLKSANGLAALATLIIRTIRAQHPCGDGCKTTPQNQKKSCQWLFMPNGHFADRLEISKNLMSFHIPKRAGAMFCLCGILIRCDKIIWAYFSRAQWQGK